MKNYVLNKPVFFFQNYFIRFAVALLFVLAVVLPSSASAQTYTLDLVADQQTLIPGGFGLFDNFNNPVSLDTVESEAFLGSANAAQGIYTNVGGSVVLAADESTAIPGGSGTFFSFNNPVPWAAGTWRLEAKVHRDRSVSIHSWEGLWR